MEKIVQLIAVALLTVCAIAVAVLGLFIMIQVLNYIILPLTVVILVFCGLTFLFGYIKGLVSNG